MREFLYDDYGDTVAQLGLLETRRLEQELLDLESELYKLRELDRQDEIAD